MIKEKIKTTIFGTIKYKVSDYGSTINDLVKAIIQSCPDEQGHIHIEGFKNFKFSNGKLIDTIDSCVSHQMITDVYVTYCPSLNITEYIVKLNDSFPGKTLKDVLQYIISHIFDYGEIEIRGYGLWSYDKGVLQSVINKNLLNKKVMCLTGYKDHNNVNYSIVLKTKDIENVSLSNNLKYL